MTEAQQRDWVLRNCKFAAIGLPPGKSWPHRQRDSSDEEYERRKKQDPNASWDDVWKQKVKNKKKREREVKKDSDEAASEFETACNN